MLLFERITFLLVTGTFVIFLVAVLFGVWGIALTLNPRLNSIVATQASKLLSVSKALYLRLRTKYRPTVSWRVTAGS